MIDLVYQTILTILSKDNQGYMTPEEFDKLANLAQMKIFRGYFEDENRDKNKQNKGLSNEGYSNLPFNQRQRIDQFAYTAQLVNTSGRYILPTDLYLLEEDGLSVIGSESVIEEVERKDLAYLNKSISKPTALYPVYERFAKHIVVYPLTLTTLINCRYLRKPKPPRWTYFVLPNGEVKYDPTNGSHQDFELNTDEFPNLVFDILSYSGATLREEQIIQIAEVFKQNFKQETEN